MNNRRNTITLIGLGLGLLAVVIAAILPLTNSIVSDSQQLTSYREEIKLLEIKRKNVIELKNLYQDLQLSLDKIEEVFVKDPKVPVDFIDFIEQVAQETEVEVKVVDIQWQEGTTPWPTLFFRLDCKGASTDFSRFLEELESSTNYLVSIEQLTIRGGEIRRAEVRQIGGIVSLEVFTK